MKNKIIALFLLICVLVPCFAVFSFAEGATHDTEEYRTSLDGVWKEASNGEHYNSRFDNFINVEQYIKKAPDGDRNSFDIVGVEEYWGESDSYLIFYVYNPTKSHIPVSEPYGFEGPNSGHVTVEMDGKEEKLLIQPELYDGETNGMFVRFYMDLDCGLYNYRHSDYGIQNGDERRYNIISFTLGGIAGYDEADEPYYEYQTCYNYINSTFIFKGYNNEKVCQKQGNSLADEISFLMNITPVQLKDKHAGDDTSLVFLYEEKTGTEDYKLYLYTYNSSKHTYFYGTALIYLDGVYKELPLYVSEKEDEFTKFEVGIDEFNHFESIREYYIANIKLFYNGTVNGIHTLKTDKVDLEARYVYSDIPSDSFRPSSFYYDLSDTVINAPSFAGNNTGKYLAEEEYLITFESKDVKNYTVYANAALFTITEQGEMWVKIKMLADSDSIYFSAFDFYSTFPDLNYPDLSISITRIVPEDATEEEKASITTGSMSVDVDVNFSPERIYPVLLMANDYVQPKAKYLTAEVNGVIKINANYTYYRLDSSVNGVGKYQTLSTLYFSVPNKYLQSSAIPIVDSKVSAVELSYSEAMTNPILYESGYNADFRRTLEALLKHEDGIYKAPFIYTANEEIIDTKDPESGSTIYTHVSDYFFGYKNNVMTSLGNYYTGNTIIEYPPVIIYGDSYSEIKPMGEFLSTKELTKILQETNSSFGTDFTPNKFVIKFDDEKTLVSYKDKTFWDVVKETDFVQAIFCKLAGYLGYYQDTIKNIKCIETMSGMKISKALKVSDEVFASTYYVALSDVPNIKSQMKNALSNNESFVFVRFDVFDYYSEYAKGFYVDTEPLINEGHHCDYDEQVVCFQTKYYENLDILRMETSNGYTTTVYDVEMEEIDTSAGGATGPKPLPGPGSNDGIDWEKFFKDLKETLSIILVVIVVLVIFIYFAPVIVFVIKAILAFFKKIFVAIGNGIKRLTNRRKQ